MVFSVFDRSALHQIIHDGNHMYYRHEYEPATIMQGLTNAASYWDNYSNIFSASGVASGTISGYTGTGSTPSGTVAGHENTTFTNDITGNVVTAVPNNTIDTVKTVAEYLDQVMPFDCTLAAQNEYGMAAWMAIVGIEILNEGGGLSIDDIQNEEQCTYVCRSKTPWIPWNKDKLQSNDLATSNQGPSSIKIIGGSNPNRQLDVAEISNYYNGV